jgi:hypothetical protein
LQQGFSSTSAADGSGMQQDTAITNALPGWRPMDKDVEYARFIHRLLRMNCSASVVQAIAIDQGRGNKDVSNWHAARGRYGRSHYWGAKVHPCRQLGGIHGAPRYYPTPAHGLITVACGCGQAGNAQPCRNLATTTGLARLQTWAADTCGNGPPTPQCRPARAVA